MLKNTNYTRYDSDVAGLKDVLARPIDIYSFSPSFYNEKSYTFVARTVVSSFQKPVCLPERLFQRTGATSSQCVARIIHFLFFKEWKISDYLRSFKYAGLNNRKKKTR